MVWPFALFFCFHVYHTKTQHWKSVAESIYFSLVHFICITYSVANIRLQRAITDEWLFCWSIKYDGQFVVWFVPPQLKIDEQFMPLQPKSWWAVKAGLHQTWHAQLLRESWFVLWSREFPEFAFASQVSRHCCSRSAMFALRMCFAWVAWAFAVWYQHKSQNTGKV